MRLSELQTSQLRLLPLIVSVINNFVSGLTSICVSDEQPSVVGALDAFKIAQ